MMFVQPQSSASSDSAGTMPLCAHCRGPILPGQLVAEKIAGSTLAFCCHGCLGAYRIITGAALGDFYRRRDWQEQGLPAGVFSVSQEEESLFASLATPAPGGAELVFLVEGIRCASCIWLLERLLIGTEGVSEARLSYGSHRCRVRFDPTLITPGRIVAAIRRIGYLPLPPGQEEETIRRSRERRDLLMRFGTAAFFSMQLMGFSLALYAGYFQGMEAETKELLNWLAAAAATPVLLYSALPFWRGAWRSLAARMPDMDLLVAIGLAATYSFSLAEAMAGGEVYFDTAAMIVTFLLLGRLVESGARDRAADTLDRVTTLVPRQANRLNANGEILVVPASSLVPGDRIITGPGERFPVDGVIAAGESEIDESVVTGEPMPVAKGPEQAVLAGALNLSAAVTIRVTQPAASSFMSRVARLVDEAQTRKAPLQRMADRVAALFTPLVLVLALGTALYWQVTDSAAAACTRAVAVLVVACPCALGLATPLAVLMATATAARHGILFRGGDTIEAAAGLTVAAFDKTGTLTEGRPRIMAVYPADGLTGALDAQSQTLGVARNGAADQLLALAAQAEMGSSHPIARAILEEAGRRGLTISGGGGRIQPGRGVEMNTTAGTLRVGNIAFLAEAGVILSQQPAWADGQGGGPGARRARDGESPAMTEVHVAQDHTYLGFLLVDDALRPEAATTVAVLRQLGLVPVLLTGDSGPAARRVAEFLGIEELEAAMTPDAKKTWIEQKRAAGGRVLMTGDGVNDAPALAAATVGCALGGGADITLGAGGLVLTQGGIGQLGRALRLARRTVAIIRQNLFWAFIYNIAMLPLAASGRLAPVWAAAAMAASSVFVALNSLRLGKQT